jgi:hypothetical protein
MHQQQIHQRSEKTQKSSKNGEKVLKSETGKQCGFLGFGISWKY